MIQLYTHGRLVVWKSLMGMGVYYESGPNYSFFSGFLPRAYRCNGDYQVLLRLTANSPYYYDMAMILSTGHEHVSGQRS